ncbi:MAG: hypothetical protein H7178_04990 [Chitinophagaceae bacterium]|nr:hypothetical protein [Chitinophagaceae bacterium]
MKKTISLLLAAVVFITSCKTLTSTTYIKPNESFVLGNNEHGEAKVKLKNISPNSIEVHHAPIAGGKHSSQIVKPNETVTVYIEKNTALVIVNATADKASVELFVTGDLGLSMGYK